MKRSAIAVSTLCVMFALGPGCVASMAQDYEPGDEIVVIADATLSVDGNTKVDDVWPGLVLKVQKVAGKWLWLTNGKPGWLDQRHVIPLNRAAVDRFTELIRDNSSDARLYNARADIWKHLGELDIALSDYSEAIRLHPAAAYFTNRARVWCEKNDFDKAIADYNEAIRLDPRSFAAYHNRGQIWSIKGEYGRAIADYDEAIRIEPKLQVSFVLRGGALRSIGETEKAMSDANEAIRLDPASADAFNLRGALWNDRAEYDKALSDYNLATKLDSQLANAFTNRGQVWQVKGEFEKAISDFNRALTLDPSCELALVGLGQIWLTKGDCDQAIRNFSEAIKIDPANIWANKGRRRAWAINQEYKKIVDDYAQEISLRPKDPRGYNGLAWLLATCTEEKCRDGTQAVANATKACELTGWNDSGYLDTLAAAYAEKGDFPKATEWQAKAIGLAKQDQQADLQTRLELYRAGNPYRN